MNDILLFYFLLLLPMLLHLPVCLFWCEWMCMFMPLMDLLGQLTGLADIYGSLGCFSIHFNMLQCRFVLCTRAHEHFRVSSYTVLHVPCVHHNMIILYIFHMPMPSERVSIGTQNWLRVCVHEVQSHVHASIYNILPAYHSPLYRCFWPYNCGTIFVCPFNVRATFIIYL